MGMNFQSEQKITEHSAECLVVSLKFRDNTHFTAVL